MHFRHPVLSVPFNRAVPFSHWPPGNSASWSAKLTWWPSSMRPQWWLKGKPWWQWRSRWANFTAIPTEKHPVAMDCLIMFDPNHFGVSAGLVSDGFCLEIFLWLKNSIGWAAAKSVARFFATSLLCTGRLLPKAGDNHWNGSFSVAILHLVQCSW